MGGLKNIHRHQQGEVKRSVGPQKKHLCLRKKMCFFFLVEAWRLGRCPPGRRGHMDNRHNYRAEGA